MAKQFLGWYLVVVFLVSLNLFIQATAATDKLEVVALQDLGSPPQLKGCKLVTGNPCEEQRTGVSCSGSSMMHLKPVGLNLVESLGGQLDTFHNLRDVSSNNILGKIPHCLSPNATHINLACNELTRYIPQSLSFLTYLLHLNLRHKLLSGPNGTVFSGLKNLKDMFLQSSKSTGSVLCLAKLPLTDLKIDDNHFSGLIPQQFWSIPNIRFDMGSNRPPWTFPLDNVSLLRNKTSTQSSTIEDYCRTNKKRLSPEAIGYRVVLAVTIAALLFAILIKRSRAPRLNSLERTSNTFIFSMWIANLIHCVTSSTSPPPLVSTFRTEEFSLGWVFAFVIFIAALIFFNIKGLKTERQFEGSKAEKEKVSKRRNKKRNKVKHPKGRNDNVQQKGEDNDVQPKGEDDGTLEIGDRRLLVYTNKKICLGEEITVFRGYFDEEVVAVKSVSQESGRREVDILRKCRHQNIVAYRWKEECGKFLYIALELCDFKLDDLISQASEETKVFELWKPNEENKPSLQLLKLMKQIATGVAFLHTKGIVHCDLKPAKILIKKEENRLLAMVCGLDTGKTLLDVTNRRTAEEQKREVFGTTGWQAPEVLNRAEILTNALDVFSLGCIFFYCLTKGKHAFGEEDHCNERIVQDQSDIFALTDHPEAENLISKMIAANPEHRPSAQQVKNHPLFWEVSKRIKFLQDANSEVQKVSKRIKFLQDANSEVQKVSKRIKFLQDANSEVQKAVSQNDMSILSAVQSCLKVSKRDPWHSKLDPSFVRSMNKRPNQYDYIKVADLLRFIRNAFSHHKELDQTVQAIVGTKEEELFSYFSSSFPKLFMNIYEQLLYQLPCPADLERYKWR